MDFGGTIILIASVCCMLLALQWGGSKFSWKSSQVIGLFVGFGVLVTLFGYLQYRLGDRATIPRKILLQRSILMGCCYVFFLNMSNYTVGSVLASSHERQRNWTSLKDGYFLPFYFQAARGLSATRSGINFVPLAFPQVFGVLVVGGIVSKVGRYVSKWSDRVHAVKADICRVRFHLWFLDLL